MYHEYQNNPIETDILKLELNEKVKQLKGKALGCHCYPLRCHGEHLKQLADGN